MSEITCRCAQTLTFNYIDGELSDKDKCKFEDHLQTCSNCKNELDKNIELLKLISESEYEPPENLYGAVMEKVRTLNRNKYRKLYYSIGSAVAAAAVFMLVFFNSGMINRVYNAAADSDVAAAPAENESLVCTQSAMAESFAESADEDYGAGKYEYTYNDEVLPEQESANAPLSKSSKLMLRTADQINLLLSQYGADEYTESTSVLYLCEFKIDNISVLGEPENIIDSDTASVYVYKYSEQILNTVNSMAISIESHERTLDLKEQHIVIIELKGD